MRENTRLFQTKSKQGYDKLMELLEAKGYNFPTNLVPTGSDFIYDRNKTKTIIHAYYDSQLITYSAVEDLTEEEEQRTLLFYSQSNLDEAGV